MRSTWVGTGSFSISLTCHPECSRMARRRAVPRSRGTSRALEVRPGLNRSALSNIHKAVSPERFLPAHLHPLILLIEPLLERREIFQDRAGVHFALPGQGFHGVGPGLTLTHFEHLAKLCAGFF